MKINLHKDINLLKKLFYLRLISVSSMNDDIEEKQREEQADKKLRRGDVGDRDIVVETGGSTVLDDSKIIDESQQQHCDDVDTMSSRHSSIWFQNEREDLYHETRPSQHTPCRFRAL